MTKETQIVLNHLQSKCYFNSLQDVIVLPTTRQTKEALELDIEQVEEAYQDLLEYGVIEEYSQFQFIPALQFKIPERLKRILGLR